MKTYLKFDDQTLSKELEAISISKAVCELGYNWEHQGLYAFSGSGWYRYMEWRCTDPDNNQFGRKIGDKLYEFAENNFSKHETIDLNKYSNKEIDEHLSPYGWSIEILKKDHSPEDAEWLYAECIFEQTLN